MTRSRSIALALLALAPACTFKDSTDEDQPPERGVAQAATPQAAAPLWDEERPLTPEELNRGRLDEDWTQVVQLDPWTAGNEARSPEKWEQISARTVNGGPVHLPVFGDVGGPTVFRIQVLLDRALFSPGMIDGRWGKNTAKAVYWLQKREGIPATGRADSATFSRLAQLAGEPEELVLAHRLTAGDVEGPFIDLPEGNGDEIYEIAEKECTCYESLTEKLTETFHVTADLLRQLNPGVDLDGLRAGQTLNVPNVRDPDARAPGRVARIEVSGRGSFVHALDANGRILYHFPSTLGSTYDPSPQGRFTITSITEKPWWHFQPAILAHVPDDKPDARIPPGPNNAVGIVWMDLSVPHYGIHGTKSPETIGYATSAGCVRLTNWDALFLSRRVERGTPVRFRDTRSGGAAGGERPDTSGGSTPRASGSGEGTRDRSRRGSDTATAGRRREGERAKSREESGSRSRSDTTSRRSPR